MSCVAFLPSSDLAYESGSVLYAHMLSRALSDAGRDVRILARSRPDRSRALGSRAQLTIDERLLDHPVVTDRSVSDQELSLNYEACLGFLERQHGREPLSAVYAQYLSFGSAAAVDFAKAKGVPVVVSSFGRDLELGVTSDARLRDYAIRALRGATAIVVPNRAVEARLRTFCVDTGANPEVLVSPPPVDWRFKSGRAKPRPTSRGETIAMVASCFKPDKGIETAIEALARCVAGGTPATLAIAGTDDHPAQANRSRLKESAEELGVGQYVQFLGYLAQPRVQALLETCDLFVDARTTSGFSSSLVEALVTGAAVACSRTTASEELITDGENGLFFEPGDVGGLESVIRDCLTDTRLTARLQSGAASWSAANGQRYVGELALAPVVALIERVIGGGM